MSWTPIRQWARTRGLRQDLFGWTFEDGAVRWRVSVEASPHSPHFEHELVATATLPVPVGQDVRIAAQPGFGLGRTTYRPRLEGAPETTRWLIASPDVAEPLGRLLSEGARVTLQGLHLRVRSAAATPGALDATWTTARDLAKGVCGRWWQAFQPLVDGGLVWREGAFTGRLQGLVTSVRPLTPLGNGWSQGLAIAVGLPRPLPPGTRIARSGTGPSTALGDPVLEATLHVTGDADALRPILCRDAVRERLLEIVHAHRGSEVGERAVLLVRRDRPLHDVLGAVRPAVELARLLSVPPPPSLDRGRTTP